MTSHAADLREAVSDVGLKRTRIIVYLGAFAVALFATFVIWRAQAMVEQTNDLYKFAELGRSIASGKGFAFAEGPPTIRRAPLYPAMIALIYTVFGIKPVAIYLAQCFIAAGTCLLVFEIGRKVFSTRTGTIAAVVTALHPMVMRYVPDIQVETSLTFLYTLGVYRSVRLVEEPTTKNGLWFGMAAAAAAMVKGVALPYPILFVAACAILPRILRSAGPLPGWKPLLFVLLGMGIVILPWTARNYTVTGKPVLISGNASGEFLRGYVFAQSRYYLLRDAPYSVGETEANEMQRALFRSQGLVWERDETETERVQNLAMKQKLRSDPGAFVKKFFIGTFMFWYVVTTKANSLLVGTLALGGWVFSLIGLGLAGGKGYRFGWLFLPILSLNFLYAAILALGRYSAPCIPTLMVLASFGAVSLYEKVFGARRGAAGFVQNSVAP
jgi:4-amino-4-deoxy-L-arabinose transferase-like glycosyltransferase